MPYTATLNAYVTAWQTGTQDDINHLEGLLAPDFQRSQGPLQSIQHVDGDSALARVGATIRAFRARENLSERDIRVVVVACNQPINNTATATLRWTLHADGAKSAQSTLTFNVAVNPVQLSREEVRQ
jgi:hypothetical protein